MKNNKATTKAEKEVLKYLFNRGKYPLTDKKIKTGMFAGMEKRYKRHDTAFESLRQKELVYINECRIWSITKSGIKEAKRIKII